MNDMFSESKVTTLLYIMMIHDL